MTDDRVLGTRDPDLVPEGAGAGLQYDLLPTDLGFARTSGNDRIRCKTQIGW